MMQQQITGESHLSPPHKPTPLRRAVSAAVLAFPYYCVWLFPAFALVCAKSAILDCPSGPLDPSCGGFHAAIEWLGCFQRDLLWGFVVMPLLGGVAVSRFPRRWQMPLVATVALVTVAFVHLQTAALRHTGQFPCWQLWRDVTEYGLKHPDALGAYGGRQLLELFLWALPLTVLGAVLSRRMPRGAAHGVAMRWVALAAYTAVLLTTAAAWLGGMPESWRHRSAAAICLDGLLAGGDEAPAEDAAATPEAVLARWQAVSNSPPPQRASEHFGAAAHCDLLCIVLETVPATLLDMAGNLDDLPTLKLLRKRAWIAPRHTTPYPCSKYALYSMLSSRYPTEDISFGSKAGGAACPCMLRSLALHGYATAAYFPANAEDEALYRAAGTDKIVNIQGKRPLLGDLWNNQGWRQRASCDEEALTHLKRDMAVWIGENRRYAAIFYPQIGHAPWPEAIDGQPSGVSAARAILEVQDRWLGQLVELLEQSGRIDRTVILVVGDHGIRTRGEDRQFAPGVIDPLSFQVPCLLYAPAALRKTVAVAWLTSHIDLAPSILDLLGIAEGRLGELGSPIWDERIERRTTFFWGNKYLGADGFHRRGEYSMWRPVNGAAYRANTFDFRGLAPLQDDNPAAGEIIQTIRAARGLRQRITDLYDRPRRAINRASPCFSTAAGCSARSRS